MCAPRTLGRTLGSAPCILVQRFLNSLTYFFHPEPKAKGLSAGLVQDFQTLNPQIVLLEATGGTRSPWPTPCMRLTCP